MMNCDPANSLSLTNSPAPSLVTNPKSKRRRKKLVYNQYSETRNEPVFRSAEKKFIVLPEAPENMDRKHQQEGRDHDFKSMVKKSVAVKQEKVSKKIAPKVFSSPIAQAKPAGEPFLLLHTMVTNIYHFPQDNSVLIFSSYH